MNTLELQDWINDRLQANGAMDVVNRELSQVLDFPDKFFAEVVLVDASKIPNATRAVSEVTEGLKQKGLHLDAIVRAIWRVRRVQSEGAAYGETGVPRNAWRFTVQLESGNRETEVYVNVTRLALERLRLKLGIPDSSPVSPEDLEPVVREFVEMELSLGGTSSWDPILVPTNDLTAAAMGYLLERETLFPATQPLHLKDRPSPK